MIVATLLQQVDKSWFGWTAFVVAIAGATVGAYYLALFIKQVLLKKPGGLFTAKF